jgi:hypothetical protein
VVVFHHIGSPRHSTISQNERMMWVRRRMSDGFSGGGCFLVCAALLLLIATASVVEGLSGFVAPLSGGG